MPVVVANLLTRMQKEQEIAFEKEQTLKRLFETEKLAVLGQMAAGIAHELNNAISVLSKNTEWLKQRLQEFYELYKPATFPFFQKGLEEGRRLSSREVREKAKQYQVDFGLDMGAAVKLAQTGITDDMAGNFEQIDAEISEVFTDWEIGAVFHDMNVAANMGLPM